MHSVETGLPILLGDAAHEGAMACFELGRMTEQFLAVLPDEADGAFERQDKPSEKGSV
jgi:hypothetical protein